MKTKLEGLIRGEHNLVGKKALIPRTTLKSHFDSIRDVQFCANNQLLVSVSEDCMMKLWDVKMIRQTQPEDDIMIEPSYTYRGHTGPLFSVTVNNA